MANRLAAEDSPYLLQHAENPVDWYPWGPTAWQRAKAEDKPIFLSIGYSACHWCHVMAHESFENPAIAALLNERFICIKVDREERPELDQLYMDAVQIISGHGGWPMSVFLTPELEPFFGGTYWPAASRGGMPGFDEVLRAISDVWQHRRAEAVAQAQQLTAALQDDLASLADGAAAALSPQPLAAAEQALRRAFDPTFGGFGTAPKFPPALNLRLLLRRWRRQPSAELLGMVTTTLDRMAYGGMYDQLGGGFHRYSVDAHWLVPHFEKMLYDNALLTQCYLEAWQVTRNPQYARIVRETLDYVLRDMTDPAGGFYSAEDADSEGAEGQFYLWTPAEIAAVIGPERAADFCRFYDITPSGNFEERNILNRPKTLEQTAQILGRDPVELGTQLDEDRAQLLAVRSQRPRPLCDDKVLVGWNGLMIEALARAGTVLGETRYLAAAARAADFLLTHVRDEQGRLRHYWRDGRAQGTAYLDDIASLTGALVSLYEARFQERWIDEAVRLAQDLLERFADPHDGGFYFASADHEPLIARRKDVFDSSIPSGTGLAVHALLRLGKLCGRNDFLDPATTALATAMPLAQRAPTGAGQLLLALDMHLGPTPEIVILGDCAAADTRDVLDELRLRFLPNKLVAFRESHPGVTAPPSALSAIFAGKEPQSPGPTVFICQEFACQAPIHGKEAALQAWQNLPTG